MFALCNDVCWQAQRERLKEAEGPTRSVLRASRRAQGVTLGCDFTSPSDGNCDADLMRLEKGRDKGPSLSPGRLIHLE